VNDPTRHADRIARAIAAMQHDGVDAMGLSVGADLPYLTGYRAVPLERLTMLVVRPQAAAALVVPELEAPRVVPDPAFRVVTWSETDDPIDIVAELLDGAHRVAIGAQTWSRFLLAIQRRMPGVEFTSADPIMRSLRIRKDPEELAALAAVAAAVDATMASLRDLRFSGTTEREMARIIADLLLASGHEEVDFTIVASGPNAASPHHEPGSRVMAPGDTIVVDIGGGMAGYRSDSTRTLCVGEPTSEVSAAYAALRRAQEAAIAAVRPGATAGAIDRAARTVIAEAGYGEAFIHRTGHGIGLETHEAPYIVEGSDTALEPGMTFSIEPGIYMAGRWGMRLEDIVVVTADGVERLNRSDRVLYVVE